MASRKNKQQPTPRQLYRIFTVIGGFMVLAGLLLLWLGLQEWRSTREFIQNSEHAMGRVVALESQRSDTTTRKTGRTVFYAIFVFADSSGKNHRVRDTVGSNPPAYSVGDEVPVLYRSDFPRDARIKSFRSLWFMASIFGGIGVPQVILGGLAVFGALKNLRKTSC